MVKKMFNVPSKSFILGSFSSLKGDKEKVYYYNFGNVKNLASIFKNIKKKELAVDGKIKKVKISPDRKKITINY